MYRGVRWRYRKRIDKGQVVGKWMESRNIMFVGDQGAVPNLKEIVNLEGMN
jgi:hypothetical protein